MEFCRLRQSTYLCIVFFIVLDLRLTKVGLQRKPFFYVLYRGTDCGHVCWVDFGFVYCMFIREFYHLMTSQ